VQTWPPRPTRPFAASLDVDVFKSQGYPPCVLPGTPALCLVSTSAGRLEVSFTQWWQDFPRLRLPRRAQSACKSRRSNGHRCNRSLRRPRKLYPAFCCRRRSRRDHGRKRRNFTKVNPESPVCGHVSCASRLGVPLGRPGAVCAVEGAEKYSTDHIESIVKNRLSAAPQSDHAPAKQCGASFPPLSRYRQAWPDRGLTGLRVQHCGLCGREHDGGHEVTLITVAHGCKAHLTGHVVTGTGSTCSACKASPLS
jgi:hypothetical protein